MKHLRGRDVILPSNPEHKEIAMPYTLNGIGTHYYGRSNASAHRANCSSCGRLATLTSYDTRECFCVLFIPLIPLSKYRIIDQCSSCRRHHRMKLEEFKQNLEGRATPLREAVRANPTDPAAREELIRALIGFGMLSDAEAAARAAVEALPQNGALNRLAGQILSMKGDSAGAMAFLQRAVHFDKDDAAGRLSLARVYYFQRMYAEAARELEEARRVTPNDAAVLSLLAETYFQAQRWQEALASYQRIAGPTPTKPILRRIADCKKRLGYELTPMERKAARRLWPFGRRAPAKMKLASPNAAAEVQPKRLFAIVAVIAVIAVVVGLGLGFYKSRRVDVYFDSVYPRSTFIIDGERFTSDAPPLLHALSPGKHQIAVLDKGGKRVDQRAIDINNAGILDSIFSSRAFVYNTNALRVYRRESIEYAVNASDAGSSAELVAGDPFFEIRGIDYVFTAPPQTIELSSSTSKEIKTAFNTDNHSISAFGRLRWQQGKLDEAEKAFRIATKADPCDIDGRENLVNLRIAKNAGDDAAKIAHAGIEQCSEHAVEAHRLYQDSQRRLGHEADVFKEYKAALDTHPTSATLHYLFGRLLNTSEASMAEQRAAIHLDPKLGWAHAALGYELLSTGAYEESMREYAEALKTTQHDPSAILYYAYAAVASGHAADAHAVPEGAAHNESEWWAKWTLALAQKNWLSARRMYTDAVKGNEDDASLFYAGAQFLKASGDTEGYAKHLAAALEKKELKPSALIVSVHDAMESGNWTEAASRAESVGQRSYLAKLYGAASLLLNGDAKRGADRLAEISKAFREDEDMDTYSRGVLTAFISALAKGDEAAVLRALHDQPTEMKHAYFFLGARSFARGDKAHARELFRRSATASFDLEFPLLAAQRLAS
jgi:tetratricopeptide (TPR) repeat protein